jgi:hypothetical protein
MLELLKFSMIYTVILLLEIMFYLINYSEEGIFFIFASLMNFMLDCLLIYFFNYYMFGRINFLGILCCIK